MYSPKINEKLIPRLYALAKKDGIHMTELINQIIEDYLYKKSGDRELKETHEVND